MPNPLEMLKRFGSWSTTPLVDEETIQPAQDAIDSPSLGRSPGMARMQGFGAGALEGLRGMTSPAEIAGLLSMTPAAGMAGRLGSRAMSGMRGARGMQRAAAPTMDIIEEAPAVRQVMPGMDDVDSLIGDMQRQMAKIPKRQPHMETLGEVNPRYTPVGGEGMFNAGRAGAAAAAPDTGGIYGDLMRRGMGGNRGR